MFLVKYRLNKKESQEKYVKADKYQRYEGFTSFYTVDKIGYWDRTICTFNSKYIIFIEEVNE